MVPKHIGNGRGGTGLLAYLLHDAVSADARHPATSDRVAWTATSGSLSDDVRVTMRIMQGLVADAPILKRRSGVSLKGRRATKPYAHLVFSWPANQRPDREQQVVAVKSALQRPGPSGPPRNPCGSRRHGSSSCARHRMSRRRDRPHQRHGPQRSKAVGMGREVRTRARRDRDSDPSRALAPARRIPDQGRQADAGLQSAGGSEPDRSGPGARRRTKGGRHEAARDRPASAPPETAASCTRARAFLASRAARMASLSRHPGRHQPPRPSGPSAWHCARSWTPSASSGRPPRPASASRPRETVDSRGRAPTSVGVDSLYFLFSLGRTRAADRRRGHRDPLRRHPRGSSGLFAGGGEILR